MAVVALEVLAVGAGVLVDGAHLAVDVGGEVGANTTCGNLEAGTGVDVRGADKGIVDWALTRCGDGESETG